MKERAHRGDDGLMWFSQRARFRGSGVRCAIREKRRIGALQRVLGVELFRRRIVAHSPTYANAARRTTEPIIIISPQSPCSSGLKSCLSIHGPWGIRTSQHGYCLLVNERLLLIHSFLIVRIYHCMVCRQRIIDIHKLSFTMMESHDDMEATIKVVGTNFSTLNLNESWVELGTGESTMVRQAWPSFKSQLLELIGSSR